MKPIFRDLIILVVFVGLALVLDTINDNAQPTGYTLNELQEYACNTAHNADTCSKLDELGVVLREECCSTLGKCCG